ncbi:phosphatase PAP2 family protein [Zhengella mangrovi]|uniref:Phosphatase PAP2 family protein n=2 Tax=Zhengella mangrovi TaxID=1982044 RepID=A0A2G1QHK4_9HYPH|nr:phosphatase PAP2 family protein [Zhengella mangrovi]
MIVTTQFGVPLMVAFVALHWWGPGFRSHVRYITTTAGISFLLGLGINQIILLLFERIRPYDAGVTHLIIAPSADPSFPSDHATAVTAIVVAFCCAGLPKRTVFLGLAALLVMWSRVYVGTHYATDVLGGMATGLCAAIITRLFYREGNRVDRWVTSIL